MSHYIINLAKYTKLLFYKDIAKAYSNSATSFGQWSEQNIIWALNEWHNNMGYEDLDHQNFVAMKIALNYDAGWLFEY